ncbi:SGNH/GDSL hydrolase family protein [Micromonospora sp. DT201]|uniref:SGNH/GDSL hydrolase family protein n=1 Tax=Micromonospora sp. DT201 TaxID=3393442 RepID=UPI003CF7A276
MNPLLMPIIAIQGKRLRPAIEMLSPATGPESGTVGDASRSPVRIAVLGESTAAGYGVDTHDEGFPGCLAHEIVARTSRPVSWEVVGQHAATARRIRHRLLPRLGSDLDVVVVLAGASDVLVRRTPQEWGEDLSAIVDELAARANQVLVAGIPPFRSFPSIPTLLGRYLAAGADALDTRSRQVCAERPRATWVAAMDISSPDFFARDRFHPSASGYRRWAQGVADHVTI